jgi:hypothetical protein
MVMARVVPGAGPCAAASGAGLRITGSGRNSLSVILVIVCSFNLRRDVGGIAGGIAGSVGVAGGVAGGGVIVVCVGGGDSCGIVCVVSSVARGAGGVVGCECGVVGGS